MSTGTRDGFLQKLTRTWNCIDRAKPFTVVIWPKLLVPYVLTAPLKSGVVEEVQHVGAQCHARPADRNNLLQAQVRFA